MSTQHDTLAQVITPFTMSIEVLAGQAHQHGFHLGTHENLARSIVREHYHGRVKAGLPVVTIALMQNGRIIDTFYGDKWHSEL